MRIVDDSYLRRSVMRVVWVMTLMGFTLVPAFSFVAYQDPLIVGNDGKQIMFRFTGDAGEPGRDIIYVVQANTAQKTVRE